jgi:mycothiol synthase
MNLEFQTLITREDWDLAAHLHNLYLPEEPYLGEDMMESATEHPPDIFVRRYILRVDGEPSAYLRFFETYWMTDKGGACQFIEAPSAEVYGWALDRVEAECREAGMEKLMTWFLDDRHAIIEHLLERGYERGQVNPATTTDLQEFDITPFQSGIERVKADGYEIIDLPEFARRFPEDWDRRYYDWEMAIMPDVPMPGEFQAVPFDSYAKNLRSGRISREGYWIALKDDVVAAATQVNRNRADPNLANTGLTGVIRAHRRRGLATALKATAMDWGRRAGIQRLHTDNEENNPMLQLNYALSFRQFVSIVGFSKKLA